MITATFAVTVTINVFCVNKNQQWTQAVLKVTLSLFIRLEPKNHCWLGTTAKVSCCRESHCAHANFIPPTTLICCKQAKPTLVNLSPWPLIKAKQRNNKSHSPPRSAASARDTSHKFQWSFLLVKVFLETDKCTENLLYIQPDVWIDMSPSCMFSLKNYICEPVIHAYKPCLLCKSHCAPK